MVDLMLQGEIQKFTAGRITLDQGVNLRTYAYNPTIPGYLHAVTPQDTPYRSFQFRKGRIETRILAFVNLLIAPSRTMQFVNGRLGITTAGLPAVGAVSEFAVWPSTALDDPVNAYVDSVTVATAGGVTQPAGRISATIALNPATSRFLGVGGRWVNVPDSSGIKYNCYTKNVQVEAAPVDATMPSTFESARQINVYVKPDRINLSTNPGFIIDTTAFTSSLNTTVGRVARTSMASGWAGTLTAVAAGNMAAHTDVAGGANNIPVRGGEYYTVSGYFEPGSTRRNVHIDYAFVDSAGASLGVVSTPSVQERGEPTRVSFTAKAPSNAVSMRLIYAVDSAALGEVHYFGSLLVEKGTTLGAYFDGSSNADTIWRKGGTTGKTMSFLYKDRAARYAAILRILETNAPMGIGVGDPIFGQFPVDW